MLIPNIDFNYWYNQNQTNALIQNRFISMITRICNIYQINNNHKQAFFCGNEIEINRLKKLNYNELEQEIINRIIKIKVKIKIQDYIKFFLKKSTKFTLQR